MSAMTDRLPLQAGIRTDGWVGIVDDDASIRQSLARMFRGHGIRAETFGSAEDYLHHSALVEPRCIVLDVHLGGLNGFELQARLAAEGKLSRQFDAFVWFDPQCGFGPAVKFEPSGDRVTLQISSTGTQLRATRER